MSGYNGYKNWDTWNVCLWVQNDEGLYRMARDLAEHRNGYVQVPDAIAFFVETMGGDTPDGVNRDNVNWVEVAECMDELVAD